MKQLVSSQGIVGRRGKDLRLDDRFNGLIDRFIFSQDIKENSKNTYRKGLSKLLETIEIVRKRLNKDLKITGIIGTRFDRKKNLNKEVVEKIKKYFGDKVFKTLIRDNISLAEAPSFGKTIFKYAPKSHGGEDYYALAQEVNGCLEVTQKEE